MPQWCTVLYRLYLATLSTLITRVSRGVGAGPGECLLSRALPCVMSTEQVGGALHFFLLRITAATKMPALPALAFCIRARIAFVLRELQAFVTPYAFVPLAAPVQPPAVPASARTQ